MHVEGAIGIDGPAQFAVELGRQAWIERFLFHKNELRITYLAGSGTGILACVSSDVRSFSITWPGVAQAFLPVFLVMSVVQLARFDADWQAVLLRWQRASRIRGKRTGRVLSPIEVHHD